MNRLTATVSIVLVILGAAVATLIGWKQYVGVRSDGTKAQSRTVGSIIALVLVTLSVFLFSASLIRNAINWGRPKWKLCDTVLHQGRKLLVLARRSFRPPRKRQSAMVSLCSRVSDAIHLVFRRHEGEQNNRPRVAPDSVELSSHDSA